MESYIVEGKFTNPSQSKTIKIESGQFNKVYIKECMFFRNEKLENKVNKKN